MRTLTGQQITNNNASLEGCTPNALCVPIKVGPRIPQRDDQLLIHLILALQGEKVLTNIQRITRLGWDPPLIGHDELLDQLDELFVIEGGEGDTSGGLPMRNVSNQRLPESANHGRGIVDAELTRFILFIFISGLKSLTAPSSPL